MVRVAMRLPKDPQKLYTRCLGIWKAIKADTKHFPDPYPPAGEIDQDLTDLEAALKEIEGGTPADTAALEVAANKVRQTFGRLGKYVEAVVLESPIEDAPAILGNVLLYVSNVGKRAPKPPLEVRQGAPSGIVLLIALAVPKATVYYWEYSLDQQTWTVGGQSSKTRGSIAGLTPGKLYYFRFRAFKTDDTFADYSQAVSFMVK